MESDSLTLLVNQLATIVNTSVPLKARLIRRIIDDESGGVINSVSASARSENKMLTAIRETSIGHSSLMILARVLPGKGDLFISSNKTIYILIYEARGQSNSSN